MNNIQDSAQGAALRAVAEAALADYPNLSEDRLAALIGWFRKDASSLDVALLASNEAIAEPYRRFRADHIDPLKGRDLFRGLIAVAVAAAIVLVMVWRAF